MYNYELIYNGSPANLQYELPRQEQKVPENQLVELRLNFRYRFSGFENTAALLNNDMRNRGVIAWPGNYQLVFVDPREPVWYVRWKKGAAWGAIIIAAIIIFAIILAVMIGWSLYKAIMHLSYTSPSLILILVIAGLAILFSAAGGPQKPKGVMAEV